MAEPEPREPTADAVAAGALAVAAAALLLSLFLRWARLEGASAQALVDRSPDATGWELLSGLDLVLVLASLGGLALALALVSGARLGGRALALAATGFAAVLALVVRRAIDPPLHIAAGRGDVVAALGPYVAMGALASMLLATVLAALWRT